MKIALVVHDFVRGTGHGRYCIELARRFSREHEVHVLANRFETELDFSCQQHFVKAWRATALSSVLTFPAAAQKILDGHKFDVIHAQGFACRRADVITAHVCNAARYKQSPPASLRKRLFPVLVIPRERAFFQSLQAAAVISVSRVIQAELQSEYGVASEVIYHGIDTAEFAFTQQTSERSWLFAGEAVKGLAQAITALREFPDARLRVITRSPMEPYRTLAARSGVSERVDFEGPASDMPRVYQSAGLFVYPSEYDSFGLVVAEAMASGLLVVVGKNIGAAEWIQDGQNGFLCDPREAKSLVAQLRRIEKLPSQDLEKTRAAARQTALDHTWDECARRTLAVYHRAISSRRVKK